ncbi:hypothetical protein [Piscirickettsia litoralis]|uniref:Uncharacterized protein n=1 Tax=Piscirickettsia litoralis TaxID=1891921 RepID=A0ABX2ZXJ1_9GAMM|nr:hypothetical protein [Piscirickettsia litoralis]ODN40920.1 hypothetical protein BGC07_19110 [Piscirickettsia litoralis]
MALKKSALALAALLVGGAALATQNASNFAQISFNQKSEAIHSYVMYFSDIPKQDLNPIQICQQARVISNHYVTCLPIYNGGEGDITVNIPKYSISNVPIKPNQALVIGTDYADDEGVPINISSTQDQIKHQPSQTSKNNNIGVICRSLPKTSNADFCNIWTL